MNLAAIISIAIGIGIALIGIAVALVLPGTGGDFGLPVAVIIVGGLAFAAFGYSLRRRARAPKLVGQVLALILFTLVLLEFALAALGVTTNASTFNRLMPSPYMTCEETGCHLVYPAVSAACADGILAGRMCAINKQGYPSAHDFTLYDGSEHVPRLLMLGDSYTFGMAAELGLSYVEKSQADIPDALIWNAAIPGTGTAQAIASFYAFAPLLRPQLTVLGFMTNDFRDNRLPLDGRDYFIDEGKTVSLPKEEVDRFRTAGEADTAASISHSILTEIVSAMGYTRLGSLSTRLLYSLEEVAFVELGAEDVDITRKLLTELRDATDEQNSDLLIILISSFDGTAAHQSLRSAAAQIFEDLSIPYFDPTDLLNPDTDFAPPPDGHWNDAGHQKVGAMLSDCLATFFTSGNLAACAHVISP